MKKSFDDILYDEYGNSIPLTTDDFIEYLLENLYQLCYERDSMESQLAAIRSILNPQDPEADF